MIKTIFFIFFSVTLVANQGPFKHNFNLDKNVVNFIDYMNDPHKFNKDNYILVLRYIFQNLKELPVNSFKKEFGEKGLNRILNNIFNARMILRQKVKEFYADGHLTLEGNNQVKNMFRLLRFLEDTIGELYTRPNRLSSLSGVHPKITNNHFPWTLNNSKYSDFDVRQDLKAGDILLWRGETSVSAAIARIGGHYPSQFSHVSIIHEVKGKLLNVEAVIEAGTINYSIDKIFKKSSARMVVYRYPDEKVARLAAKFIFDRAKLYEETHGKSVPYDFTFDTEDSACWYCSELVHYGYKEASYYLGLPILDIPAFKTQFDMKNRQFLNHLGTNAYEGFQPGDIDLDPRFELVAEWRNYNSVYDNHIKDMIFSKMYEWMETYEYNFIPNTKNTVLAWIAYKIRRMPSIGNIPLIKKNMSLEMSIETLSTIITMDSTMKTIFSNVRPKLIQHLNETGFSMSAKEIMDLIEEFREVDLELYVKQRGLCQDLFESKKQNFRRAKFHNNLRPRNPEKIYRSQKIILTNS